MNSGSSPDSDDLGSLLTVRPMTSGEKVFSRFVLDRLLGRGGMGVVWLATDTELDQQVALKFLPEVVLGDITALDDLKRETRRSRELTHPHIVRIHDFLRDGRTAAISMEFIDGSTLAEKRIAQPQRIFEPDTLLPWMRTLCEALDYAHSRPKAIIHRDLKPANLMLDAAGELKVTDFGLASCVSDSVSRASTHAGSSGTPVYMSPQQMMGERPSPTDDIYAFGSMLYELLTSKPPFYSGNILLQVQSRVPPSLAERRSELEIEGQPIPALWEELVAACLEKEAANRPQTFRELAARLQAAGQRAEDASIGFDETVRGINISAIGPSSGTDGVQGPTTRDASPAGAPPDSSSRPRSRKDVVPPVAGDAKASGATAAAPAPVEGAVLGERKRQRSSPALKWGIGAGVAAALVAGAIWGLDVLGRYNAARAATKADAALLDGRWDDALARYENAVALRPADAAYLRAFDEAQQNWLRALSAELEPLSPEQAHAHLQGAPLAMSSRLAGAHANEFRRMVDTTAEKVRANVRAGLVRAEALAQRGRFAEAYAEIAGVEPHRKLVSDFDLGVDRVRAIEVQGAMQNAQSLAQKGDFDGAFAALAALEKHRALVPEFDRAVTSVREAQMRHEINAALGSSAARDFDGALARLAETEKRDTLPAEVAAARTQVREAQVRDEVSGALASSAARNFEEALAQLAETEKRGMLAAEIAAARAQVREAQARDEIGAAFARLGNGDFKAAVAQLESASLRGVLSSEIAAARAQVRRQGEVSTVDRLPGAIIAGDAPAVQEIIDDYAAATGYQPRTTATQLLGEKNLDGFLRALEDLHLRPANEEERTHRLDLVLVDAQRARFADRKAVAAFLGQGYGAWAAELVAKQQHGFSLYVANRARAEGVAVDPLVERNALAALAREFDFRLVVCRPESGRQTPAVLQSTPLESLRARLTAAVGTWMPVTDGAAGTRSSASNTGFLLRTRVNGVETQDDRTEQTQYAQYQSGWNERPNPEYYEVAAQLDRAETQAAQLAATNAQNQQQTTNTGTVDRTTAIFMGVASGLTMVGAQAAQREATRLRGVLAQTPLTIRDPVYANEPYQVITHDLTYTAELSAEVEWRGDRIGVPQDWQATAAHQAIEIVGNSARNVPVRRPEYPDGATIARQLAGTLSEQVKAGAGPLLVVLGEASFGALERKLEEQKASPAQIIDRQWGLLQLWRTSGVNLPPGELELLVREHLGLPAVVALAPEPEVKRQDVTTLTVPMREIPPHSFPDNPPTGGITLTTRPEEMEAAGFELSEIYELRDLDKPPQPVSQAEPVLTSAQKRAGLKGTVVLSFIVDARGMVRDVELVRSTRAELVKPATDAVLKWRFRPGLKGSKPVDVLLQQSIIFK